MKQSGTNQPEDGETPRLQHLGAHAKNGLQRLASLKRNQGEQMFRTKIDLAFESQVDFFPEHLIPLVTLQGGQTLQAVFGVRAKVLQTRRLSVFGLIRPGLFHFTDAEYLLPSSPTGFGLRPETHFVLNLGGGLEYYVSPRWVLRADIEGDPYRAPNSSVALPGGGTLFSQGKIDDTTRL